MQQKKKKWLQRTRREAEQATPAVLYKIDAAAAPRTPDLTCFDLSSPNPPLNLLLLAEPATQRSPLFSGGFDQRRRIRDSEEVRVILIGSRALHQIDLSINQAASGRHDDDGVPEPPGAEAAGRREEQ